MADFSPIAMISTVPSLLVGNPKLPAADLKALIGLAKSKPGKLTIAESFRIGCIGRLHEKEMRGLIAAVRDVLDEMGTADLLAAVS